MKQKFYWGIVTLIILLIGVSAFLFMRSTDTKTQPENVYIDVEPSPKQVKEVHKEKATEPIGHFHADGSFHEGTHAEHANDVPDKVVYPHQELLDTHPVAALRAQAKDRGHWSEKYIPPFPPDDAEANELARAIYIFVYRSKIKGFSDADPAIRAAKKVIYDFSMARNKATVEAAKMGRMSSARGWDLWKLNWAYRDSLPIPTNRLHRIPSNFDNQGGSQ